MARKPVTLEMAGGKGSRQRIWEAIRALRVFTAHQVRGELPGNIPKATIHTYLKSLAAGGYLVDAPVADGEKTYELAMDVGIEAPRVRKDGSPVAQGRGQEALWGAMEALSSFNARVLASLAGVPLITTKRYCAYLHKAGYLVVEREGKGIGQGGIQTVYRLLRSRISGPRPPMITRLKTVYDPNTGKIVWQQTPEEALDD